MEKGTRTNRRKLIQGMGIGIAVAGAGDTARAIDPGTAQGTLKVNSTAVALTHAVVFRKDNAEGVLDNPELRIALTDREIASDLLADLIPERLEMLARDGKVRGLLWKLDARTPKQALQGTLLLPPGKPTESLVFFTRSNTAGIFERFETSNNRVVGEAKHASEPKAEVAGYDYAVSFTAPLLQDGKITDRPVGPPAVRHPAAQVYLGFQRALRTGDLEVARRFASPDRIRQVEMLRRQLGEAAFRQQVKQFVPEEAGLVRTLRQVVVRTDVAVVVLQERPDAPRSGETLRLVSGVWRLQ